MSELEIWNELGNIYFKAGAYDQAIHAYQKAIDLDLGSGKSFCNLVSMYIEKEFYTEAISTCQKGIELLESKSERAILWNKLGDIFLRQHEYERALSAYQAAVDLEPDNEGFRQALDQAQLHLCTLVQAGNEINPENPTEGSEMDSLNVQPVALTPAASEPEEVGQEFITGSEWSYEADPAESEGNSESSGSEDDPIVESITVEPPLISESEPVLDEMQPQTVQENVLPQVGGTSAAAEATKTTAVPPALPTKLVKEEKHKSAPKMDEPVNIRAQALLKLGLLSWCRSDYETALQYLKTALNLAAVYFDNQFEALCLNAIGRLEIDLGRPVEAIRAYENAAAFDPDNIFPWSSLGYLYSKADRYEEAVAAFKKAIAHDSQDPHSWNGLGDVYARQGRFEEAISAYQLGNIFDGSIHDEDALAMVQMASDCEGESPRILEEMGNINFLNGAYSDAIDAFLNAIELLNNTGDSASLWKRVGDTWQRLNNAEKASAAYQKAADLNTEMDPLPTNSAAINQVFDPSVQGPGGNTEKENFQEAATDNGVLAQPDFDDTAETFPAFDELEAGDGLFETGSPAGMEENEPEIIDKEESQPLKKDSEPEEGLREPVPSIDMPETAEEDDDPPYWVFRTTSTAKPASRPVVPAPQTSGGFKLLSAPSKVNFNTSPNVVMPKLTVQPSLGTAILTDMLDDPTMLMVEERSTQPQRDRTGPALAVDPSPIHNEQRCDGFGPRPAVLKEVETGNGGSASLVPECTQALPDSVTVQNDIAAYKHLVEQNPNNDRAWDALGNLYEAIGLHDEAISVFEKAISLASQRELYHYHIGLSYASQKHYEKAIQALQKVVALNPDFMLAHCALAGYYRRVGKEAEAREHVTIARPYIEHENDYNQACFESICGNIDRSLDLLRKALKNGQVKMDLLQNDPDLDFIRADPRFEALAAAKTVAALV